MKFNKSLIIISLLLIFCISLGAVSATEMEVYDITDVYNVDDTQSIVIAEDNTNPKDVEISELQEEQEGTFKELNELINNATEGSTINLTKNYKNNGRELWININKSLIINGQGHTIDASSSSSIFKVYSANVVIKNIKFINTKSNTNGGAIFWCGDNGSVINCSFINCSSNSFGGAVFLSDVNNSVVRGCSFINCSASYDGGAVYLNGLKGKINYNIFENNNARNGKAISIEKSFDCNFNFFGFENNVTNFPSNLVYGATPNNWVVLNISKSGDLYVVKFVSNNGSDLNDYMPDYTGRLNISDAVKDVTVANNTYNDTLVEGDYLLTSLNSGKILVNTYLGHYVVDYEIITFDCDYGGIATVVVRVNKSATGNISVKVDDNQVISGIIKEGYSNILINGLTVGTHSLYVSYAGDENFYPFNDTATVTVFGSSDVSMNVSVAEFKVAKVVLSKLTTTYASGKYYQIKVLTKDNKAIKGVKVTFRVYTGKKYKTVTGVTDANGIIKYAGSKLSIGTHKIVVTSVVYKSTKLSSSKLPKASSIVIKKCTTTVSASKVINKYKKSAYFKVTIKNKATGKVISGLTLKIKVYTGKKYKTYTVKTNSNGVAYLNTKALKKGTHKVVISSGNTKYTVSKSGNLIVIK